MYLAVPPPSGIEVEIGSNSAEIEFQTPDYDAVTSYEVRHYPVGRPSAIQIQRIDANAEKRITLAGIVNKQL